MKCSYLGINKQEDMASFDIVDELINAKELSRHQECSGTTEKLFEYLETNIIPLVLKKVRYVPLFHFFLSHKSQDKAVMHTFRNGLKFLGYSTWIDESWLQMSQQL